jgi:mRNA interferase YafQ
MMKRFESTKRMDKDVKQLKSRHYDMNKLGAIVKDLRLGVPLDPKYKNHKLGGNYKGYFDLHIEPDWVLLYQVDDDCVYLYRTGTHAVLLE